MIKQGKNSFEKRKFQRFHLIIFSFCSISWLIQLETVLLATHKVDQMHRQWSVSRGTLKKCPQRHFATLKQITNDVCKRPWIISIGK